MLNEDSTNNDEDAGGILTIDLRRVTSSEPNALILEKLHRDECSYLSIFSDGDEDGGYLSDFIVGEGDDLYYLGNFIGKSTRLECLSLCYIPGNDSFRDGLALNKSIQTLRLNGDLGEEGVQGLAPFFRNTNSLDEIKFRANSITTESMKGFAFLLGQCQIPSLKRINLEGNELDGDEYTELARGLSMQPQLEILSLGDRFGGNNNDSFHGHIALGDTMKNWKSPCLKVLEIGWCNVGDDGLLALVEGMTNCSKLERLNLAGNDRVTEVGLRALSSLFQSKEFLSSINLRDMNITDDGMTALIPGLASLKSLRRLDLSNNNIGDEGLQALAAAQPDFRLLENLAISSNAGFLTAGLTSLSILLQTMSSLEYLNLSHNAIDDDGLNAFITGMRRQCTIERLDLSSNMISSLGPFTAFKMSSLRHLKLDDNNVVFNDEAIEALVEAMKSLCGLEYLSLNRITSSGLSILATVFQPGRSCLKELNLGVESIGDSGAIALANGLNGNKSLKKVYFDKKSVTDVGWSAFERLLCDTSSVNNTYSSNHTLEIIGNHYLDDLPFSIDALLDLNKQKDLGVNVPIWKILMSHSDFNIPPLLQWKLKLLPFVVTWFERARSSQPTRPRIAFEGRKLSAIYQFVSGASHSVLEGCIHSKTRIIACPPSRKRKLDQCDDQ